MLGSGWLNIVIGSDGAFVPSLFLCGDRVLALGGMGDEMKAQGIASGNMVRQGGVICNGARQKRRNAGYKHDRRQERQIQAL